MATSPRTPEPDAVRLSPPHARLPRRHALFLRARGDREGARARPGDLPAKLRADLEREPGNTQRLRTAARVEAIWGNKEEALRRVDQAAEIYPESAGTIGASTSEARTAVLAVSGDTDRALEEIVRRLRIPSPLNIHGAKVDLSPASRCGDGQFEALVKDPRNNAPRFGVDGMRLAEGNCAKPAPSYRPSLSQTAGQRLGS